MSDELTQAPEEEVQDTLAEDAAPEGTPAPDSEYTPERARGLHAELTKAQQELADFKHQKELWSRAQQGNLDAMRELQLPVDFGEEDALEDVEQDDVPHDPRVDALIQEREQEREAAIVRDVSGHIDTLLGEAKIEVPARFKQAILQDAWMRGGGAQIQPGTTQEVVKEWIAEYKQLEQKAGDRYVQSKKDAPHISPGGTGATEVIDPLDGNARRQRLIAKVSAAGG